MTCGVEPSRRELSEQGLGRLHVQRVQTLSEPAIDRGEKFACLDRARAAPCSSLRATPTTLRAACARLPTHARRRFAPLPHLFPATCGRFHRLCGGPRLRTTMPCSLPPHSSLPQCGAERLRQGRAAHRLSP